MATKGRTKTTQTPCGKFKKGSSKHKACMAKIEASAENIVKGGLLEAAGGLGVSIPKGKKKVMNKDK